MPRVYIHPNPGIVTKPHHSLLFYLPRNFTSALNSTSLKSVPGEDN